MNDQGKQFMEFLKKFAVVGTAIGIVSGGAVKTFVDALVANLIQPIVNTILGATNISAGALAVKLSEGNYLKFGDTLVALINFLAIMAVVYLIVKFFVEKFMGDETK